MFFLEIMAEQQQNENGEMDTDKTEKPSETIDDSLKVALEIIRKYGLKVCYL